MSQTLDPIDLVERLHRGDKEARDRLRRLCLGSIECLVDHVIGDHRPRVDRDVVIDRTMCWVEVYLRSRPPAFVEGMGSHEFLAFILASAYKMLTPPDLDGSRVAVPAPSAPLHCPNGYQVWTLCQPCEQVGGDWLGVDHEGGEDLWAIVIDVTAHGYAAYITADGLAHLWRARPIAGLRGSGRPPGEVLGAMSRELEPVLPEGVFVEAALGRFTAAGEVTVAGAGHCRVLLRRSGGDGIALRRIGGHLLGSFWGNEHDQESWSLLADDEVTLASDGLFEQPDGDGHHLEEHIVEHIEVRLRSGRILHKAVLEILEDVVGGTPRRDDITVLSVLRRGEAGP